MPTASWTACRSCRRCSASVGSGTGSGRAHTRLATRSTGSSFGGWRAPFISRICAATALRTAAARPAASSSGRRPGYARSTRRRASGLREPTPQELPPESAARRDSGRNERSRPNVVLLSGDRAPESVEGAAPVVGAEPVRARRHLGELDGTAGHPGASGRAVQPISARQMHASCRASASSEGASATRSSRERPRAEAHPTGSLGLQPGEIVEIKSREEIFATLDENDNDAGTSVRRGDARSTADGERECCAGSRRSSTRRPEGCSGSSATA